MTCGGRLAACGDPIAGGVPVMAHSGPVMACGDMMPASDPKMALIGHTHTHVAARRSRSARDHPSRKAAVQPMLERPVCRGRRSAWPPPRRRRLFRPSAQQRFAQALRESLRCGAFGPGTLLCVRGAGSQGSRPRGVAGPRSGHPHVWLAGISCFEMAGRGPCVARRRPLPNHADLLPPPPGPGRTRHVVAVHTVVDMAAAVRPGSQQVSRNRVVPAFSSSHRLCSKQSCYTHTYAALRRRKQKQEPASYVVRRGRRRSPALPHRAPPPPRPCEPPARRCGSASRACDPPHDSRMRAGT